MQDNIIAQLLNPACRLIVECSAVSFVPDEREKEREREKKWKCITVLFAMMNGFYISHFH